MEQIKEEVSKINELLKKFLGVNCTGLTAPTGCYMGLMDRPDILEFPLQGYIDCVWRDIHGYDKTEEYLNLIKTEIDYIVEKDLSWSYAQHDWSSIKGDPKMIVTKTIIEYALEKGVNIISYSDYYKKMAKSNRY